MACFLRADSCPFKTDIMDHIIKYLTYCWWWSPKVICTSTELCYLQCGCYTPALISKNRIVTSGLSLKWRTSKLVQTGTVCHSTVSRLCRIFKKKKKKKNLIMIVAVLSSCKQYYFAILYSLFFCSELLCVHSACEFRIALLLLCLFPICVGIVPIFINGLDREKVPEIFSWYQEADFVCKLYIHVYRCRF